MRIGIDLGGTKIEVVVLADDGAIRVRRRIPTPQGDYPATLAAIVDLVRGAEAECGAPCSVGLATPGSASPRDGLMRNANSTCLNGHALQHDLAQLLAREVRCANDANCFAMSEASDGAAAGAHCVFGVILGTGVGGGVVVNGRLLYGANGIAGEWGHNPLPQPEADDHPLRQCYCGRRGCIESYLSGPALQAEHARLTGFDLAPADIAGAAERGEQLSEVMLRRYEARLARALASVINLLDPDVIVLGGGLSNLDRLYRNVPALWSPHIFSDVVTTRLVPALHGDSSGVRGAAWLWEARHSC